MGTVKERIALPDRIASDDEFNQFRHEIDAMHDAFAAGDMENYDDDRFRAIVHLLRAYLPPDEPPAMTIQNNEEFHTLMAEYLALTELDPDLGTPEEARKRNLSPILHDYEKRNFHFAKPDANGDKPTQTKRVRATHAPTTPSPAAIRKRLKMSQEEFAARLGVSVRTVQDWEEGRRQPTGSAKTLLRIVDKNPEVLTKT